MPLATSIVLCTYNGARFLAAQWASLLAQSRLPDEIVVRDDGSDDGTWALLQALRSRAEDRGVNVQLHRNPRNLGYVANFAAALQDASGSVLILCDQDDVWHGDKITTLTAEFEHRADLLLLCGDARRIDAAGGALSRSLFDVLKVSRGELRRIHAGQGFGVLLRRSLATGATIALRRTLLTDALPVPEGWVHDEWLAIVAAALGGFDCVEAPLVDYRQHGGNQVGMPDRGLVVQLGGLLRPPPASVDVLLRRDRVLRERLGARAARVPLGCVQRVDEKLRHLHVRGTLRGTPWQRSGLVLREWLGGRYQRYGSGWRSALRDLLRRD